MRVVEWGEKRRNLLSGGEDSLVVYSAGTRKCSIQKKKNQTPSVRQCSVYLSSKGEGVREGERQVAN